MGKLSQLGLKPTTPPNARGPYPRTVGLRAHCNRNMAGRDGRSRTGGGTTRRVHRVPGIARLGRMHEGKLGGDGLAERVAAGGEDPCDELGVFFGLIADERGRAHFRGQVIGVEDVLHPDRNTVQRAGVSTLRALGVAGCSEPERPLIVERDPRSEPGFALADTRKARLAVSASSQRSFREPLNGPSQVLWQGRLRGWAPERHAAMAS